MSAIPIDAQTHLWHPEPLSGTSAAVRVEALRAELRRLAVEKAEVPRAALDRALDAALESVGAPSLLTGGSFFKLCGRILEALDAEAVAELEALGRDARREVVPLRSWAEHLRRRANRAHELVALGLRKLAWRHSIDAGLRRQLLEDMLTVRSIDDELKAMYFPGVPTPIPGRSFGGKGFRSTWQEAIVGVGRALEEGDIAAPLIRDLGVGIARGYDPKQVIAAQLGKASSPMHGGRPGQGGRDLHWGDIDAGLLFATAPLAIAPATLTGFALAFKRRQEARVAVSFIGEGGSSQGDWYEALNLAGVRRLPMIIFVQNNRVALGTAVERQSRVDLFADKAAAAGIPSLTVDGADPEELWAVTRAAREYALWEHGGPVLIGVEAMRGCGHAHHDDERYRKVEGERVTGYADHAAYEAWSQREPLVSFPARLRELDELREGELAELEAAAREAAAQARAEVEQSPWASTDELGCGVQPGEDALDHAALAARRAKDWRWLEVGGETPRARPLDEDGWTMRVAIEEALCAAAERWGEELLLIGEDLEYGGAFGVTQRMRSRGLEGALLDTPLAESCIISAGVGAALAGQRVCAEIQFNAFAAHAFSQIVNNAATIYWRTGRELPLVIRIPVGAGLAGGPYHALSNEAWFTATPGLRLLYPSTPHDAYHGLLEALADPAPVLYFEHLTLYPPVGRTTAFGFPVRQTVDPAAQDRILGRADLKREGGDLSIVSYGAMVHFALQAAEMLADEGIEAEVVDLRSLWPLDADAAVRSAQRTGRLMVLHEASHRGGYGHYIASRILERAFMHLSAPPLVLGSMDILPPFAPHLEAAYLPSVAGIAQAARALLEESARNRGR